MKDPHYGPDILHYHAVGSIGWATGSRACRLDIREVFGHGKVYEMHSCQASAWPCSREAGSKAISTARSLSIREGYQA